MDVEEYENKLKADIMAGFDTWSESLVIAYAKTAYEEHIEGFYEEDLLDVYEQELCKKPPPFTP